MISYSEVQATWRGSFDGEGSLAANDFRAPISLPRDFQGREIGATPEDLLTAALGSCYGITLGIVLNKAGLDHQDITVKARLATETNFPPQIKEIHFQVTVVTPLSSTQLQNAASRALEMCLISKAVDGNITKTLQVVAKPASGSAPVLNVESSLN